MDKFTSSENARVFSIRIKFCLILINATSVWTLCDRQEGLKIDAFTSSENARVTDGH